MQRVRSVQRFVQGVSWQARRTRSLWSRIKGMLGM
jgi:hypothetical protein